MNDIVMEYYIQLMEIHPQLIIYNILAAIDNLYSIVSHVTSGQTTV